MNISKCRIRKPDNYLFGIENNQRFYIGIDIKSVSTEKLNAIGFSKDLIIGNQILPAILGNISRYNVNGGFVKLKELPKETLYREIVVKDWHHNYHYVDVPYKRYQRRILPAPEIEIKIVEQNNEKIIISPILIRREDNELKIRHVINLFLELFGECNILTEDLVPSIGTIPTIRVNWTVLPQGEYPWNRTNENISPILNRLSVNNRKLFEHRVKKITEYIPTRLIIGNAGFHGYLIFEFANKGIYVLESKYSGNATYIFGNNWEALSTLTKKEILDGNLQLNRFVHRNGWEVFIDRLLS